MPTVTTSVSSPQEAIGYVTKSPLNQMEAKGSVLQSRNAQQESVHRVTSVLLGAYESLQPTTSGSGSFTSPYEALISVKATF